MHLTELKAGLVQLLAGCALLLFSVGCDRPAGEDAVAEHEAAEVGPSSDTPLAAFRIELLDIAFEAATAIPVQPHIKDRSRAQEAVVAACLELHQPRRALGCIEKIDNWRRGTCFADLAFYCAQHGDAEQAQHCLNLAARNSEGTEDWRRDRIKTKIAMTHLLLGQTEQAAKLEATGSSSEVSKTGALRAQVLDEDRFDEQISALDALLATGTFDLMNNALEAYAELFDRFYGDDHRRSLTEEKISASMSKLPIMVRIELMMKLARSALDHKDQGKAIELVNKAQLMLESFQWVPEDRVSLSARLAGLRFLSGDATKARTDADAALALFNAEREHIVDIYRAGAFRPIAETYQSMGDTGTALAVYARAVEAGVVNPNSRPRAEDLSATCLSMALHEVEPDAPLWLRIRQVREGLGPPW